MRLVVVLAVTFAVGGCSDSGGGGDMSAVADMSIAHHIFVTSANFTGNLGGLHGAVGVCASAAGTAGVHGTFIAWLSDTTTNAIDRVVNDVGPWVRLDGTLVFANKAQMRSLPSAPIDVDEFGQVTHAEGVWTGT